MMQDRAGHTDNLSSVLLALFLFVVLLLFGMGMFGISFGEVLEQPAVNMTEAKSMTLNQFPDARIMEIDLDKEDGRVVYEVELVGAEGEKEGLYINARPAESKRLRRTELLSNCGNRWNRIHRAAT